MKLPGSMRESIVQNRKSRFSWRSGAWLFLVTAKADRSLTEMMTWQEKGLSCVRLSMISALEGYVPRGVRYREGYASRTSGELLGV